MTSTDETVQRQVTLAERIFRNLNAREARLRPLWEMSVSERIAAMRKGELSLEQCAAWAARYPEQMPLVNSEFEYIAAFTPEACD